MFSGDVSYEPLDADLVYQLRIKNVFSFVGVCILYYDHLITFGDEVRQVWSRPKRAGAYWFFFSRYFAFFTNLAAMVSQNAKFGMSPQGCRQYNLFRQLDLVATQTLVGVLLTMRLYALYERSKRILALMVVAGTSVLAISAYAVVGTESMAADPVTGCHIGLSQASGLRLAAAWIALFAYDSITIVLTVRKSFLSMHRRLATRNNTPLLWLIMRDGAAYFAVMALANMANVIMFCLGAPFIKSSLAGCSSCISVTVMSRLMLNLHSIADTGISTVGGMRDGMMTDGGGGSESVALDTRFTLEFASRDWRIGSSGGSDGDGEVMDIRAGR